MACTAGSLSKKRIFVTKNSHKSGVKFIRPHPKAQARFSNISLPILKSDIEN
jgi:hypothetical protein